MKKGFTLVELLAVIAVLAILIILALPNVLGLFMSSKESAFVTEVQSVYKTAQEEFLIDNMTSSGSIEYSSRGNKLINLSKSTLGYYIRFNSEGEVLHLMVYNTAYQIVAGSEENTEPILISDLCVSSGNCKYKVEQRTAYLMFPGTLSANRFILGDIDRNGEIGDDDLIILSDYIAGSMDLTPDRIFSADINSDGIINDRDTQELQNYLDGKPSVLDNKVTYTVEHYKQKVTYINTESDEYYDLAETDEVDGLVGSTSSPLTKNYEGFNTPSRKTVTITGSDTVVKYYYTRKKYTLSINSPRCIPLDVTETTDLLETNLTGRRCFSINNGPRTERYDFIYGLHIKIISDDNVSFYQNGNFVSNKTLNFDMPSENVTYDADNSVKYTVEHYQHDMHSGGIGSENELYYKLYETEELYGQANSFVTPETKTYTGFTSPVTKTVLINSDGSTVVKYFYERKRYRVTITGNTCVVFNIDIDNNCIPLENGGYQCSSITYRCAPGISGPFVRSFELSYGQKITVSNKGTIFYLDGEVYSEDVLEYTMGTESKDFTYDYVMNIGH